MRPGSVDSFYKMRPALFTGEETAIEAEDWIISIDESLRAARIPEEDKVPLARRLLRGNARAWWLAQTGGAETVDISWAEFQKGFLAHFFPESQVAEMEERFAHLQQGTMTVDQYAAEFARLSRFSPGVVATEADRVKKFHRGLNEFIRPLLAPLSFSTYDGILYAARMQEKDLPRYAPQQVLGKRSADEGLSRSFPSQSGLPEFRVVFIGIR